MVIPVTIQSMDHKAESKLPNIESSPMGYGLTVPSYSTPVELAIRKVTWGLGLATPQTSGRNSGNIFEFQHLTLTQTRQKSNMEVIHSELDASPLPFLHLMEVIKLLPRTGWLRTIKHPLIVESVAAQFLWAEISLHQVILYS